jgi:hypothetical protein
MQKPLLVSFEWTDLRQFQTLMACVVSKATVSTGCC